MVMSFAATPKQIRNRTKTVTRRLGWDQLQPGDKITACVKTRGVPVEQREVLANIEVVKVSREFLSDISEEDLRREGFLNISRDSFIEMFCKLNRCERDTEVKRIEFKYLEDS